VTGNEIIFHFNAVLTFIQPDFHHRECDGGERLPYVDFISQIDSLLTTLLDRSFRIKGTISSPNKAGLQYALRQLEVKQDDVLQSSKDVTHVCKPVIRDFPPSLFVLPLETRLRS